MGSSLSSHRHHGNRVRHHAPLYETETRTDDDCADPADSGANSSLIVSGTFSRDNVTPAEDNELFQSYNDESSKIDASFLDALSPSTRRQFQLLSFVPRMVLDHIHSVASQRFYDEESIGGAILGPAAEKFDGCVLFIDIKGFSAECQYLVSKDVKKGVEAISQLVSDYFGAIIDTISRFGGDVIKFAGDAMIVIFGGPYRDHNSIDASLMNTLPGSFRSVRSRGDIASSSFVSLTSVGVNGSEQPVEDIVFRALICAHNISSNYRTFVTASGRTLGLHLALSAGPLFHLVVGSSEEPQPRWNHLVVGSPLCSQLSHALAESQNGEVMVTQLISRMIDQHRKYRSILRFAPVEKTKGNVFKSEVIVNIYGATSIMKHIMPVTTSQCSLFNINTDKLPPAAVSFATLFMPAMLRSFTKSPGNFDLEMVSDIRNCSILFISLSDALNQCLAAAEAAHDHSCFSTLQDSVKKIQDILAEKNGQVNHILADEKGCTMVALFGLPPSTNKDNALRAVTSASQIIAALTPLSCFIGITSAQIFSGVIGNDRRRDCAVLGSGVNLAARLMKYAEENFSMSHPHRILCDQQSYQLATNQQKKHQLLSVHRAAISSFQVIFNTNMEPVMLNGFAEKVSYFVPSLVEVATTKSARARHAVPVVFGRDQEIEQIMFPLKELHNKMIETAHAEEKYTDTESKVSTAQEDPSPMHLPRAKSLGQLSHMGSMKSFHSLHIAEKRMTVIQGPSGIGKDTICDVAQYRARVDLGFAVLRASVSTNERSTTWNAWRPLLKQLLNSLINQDRSDGMRQDTREFAVEVNHYVSVYLPEWKEYLPLLGDILPELTQFIEKSNLAYRIYAGRERTNKIIAMVVSIFKIVSKYQPYLIILCHMENFDTLSLQLLRYILCNVETLHVLATVLDDTDNDISSTRHPTAEKHKVLHELQGFFSETMDIEPLSNEAIEQVITHALGASKICAQDLVQVVVEKSNRNPFVAVQICLSLMDSKQIRIEQKSRELVFAGHIKAVTDLRIADGIREMIQQKIDALEQSQVMILKFACVIGGQFSLNMLESLVQSSVTSDELQDTILVLIQEGLLVTIGQDQDNSSLLLQFKTIIIQQVVYQSMLQKQRSKLHQQVAQYYRKTQHSSALKGDQNAQFYGIVAEHYCRAAEELEYRNVDLVLRASEFLLASGKFLFVRASFDAAVEAFDKALKLLERFDIPKLESKSRKRQSSLSPTSESTSDCPEQSRHSMENLPGNRSRSGSLSSISSASLTSPYSTPQKQQVKKRVAFLAALRNKKSLEPEMADDVSVTPSMSPEHEFDKHSGIHRARSYYDVEADDILEDTGEDDVSDILRAAAASGDNTSEEDNLPLLSLAGSGGTAKSAEVVAHAFASDYVRRLIIHAIVGKATVYYSTEGYTSENSIRMFTSAMKLCADMNDAVEPRISVICSWSIGLAQLHLGVTGENLSRYCDFCMRSALKTNDVGLVMQAHHIKYHQEFVEGRFHDVLPRTIYVCESYQQGEHEKMAYEFNHDALVCSHCHAAWVQIFIGSYEAAEESLHGIETITEKMLHPPSKVHSFGYYSICLCFLSAYDKVVDLCSEAALYAEEFSMTQWTHTFNLLEHYAKFKLTSSAAEKLLCLDNMQTSLVVLANKVRLKYHLVLYQCMYAERLMEMISHRNWSGLVIDVSERKGIFFHKAKEVLNSAFVGRGNQIYLDSVLHSLKATLASHQLERIVTGYKSSTKASLMQASLDRSSDKALSPSVDHTGDTEIMPTLDNVMEQYFGHHDKSHRIATDQMGADLVVRSLVQSIDTATSIIDLLELHAFPGCSHKEVKDMQTQLRYWIRSKSIMLCDAYKRLKFPKKPSLMQRGAYLIRARQIVEEEERLASSS